MVQVKLCWLIAELTCICLIASAYYVLRRWMECCDVWCKFTYHWLTMGHQYLTICNKNFVDSLELLCLSVHMNPWWRTPGLAYRALLALACIFIMRKIHHQGKCPGRMRFWRVHRLSIMHLAILPPVHQTTKIKSISFIASQLTNCDFISSLLWYMYIITLYLLVCHTPLPCCNASVHCLCSIDRPSDVDVTIPVW